MRMRSSFQDNSSKFFTFFTNPEGSPEGLSHLPPFKYHKFLALFCGFLNYPLSMSSDTISVMRHNNSCGKTLLDNWVEEVSYVTWAMLTSAVRV